MGGALICVTALLSKGQKLNSNINSENLLYERERENPFAPIWNVYGRNRYPQANSTKLKKENRSVWVALSLGLSMISSLNCGAPENEIDFEGTNISSRENSVIGGETATSDPAVAKIVTPDNRLCSGTLIGSRTVLTAGHCVTDKNTGDLLNYVAVEFESGFFDIVTQSNIARHPYALTTFNGVSSTNFEYDIAVLRLTNGVRDVIPIPLADFAPILSERAVVVGYGKSDCTNPSDEVKRYGFNEVRPLYDRYIQLNKRNGAIALEGDSGGPTLLARNVFNNRIEFVSGVNSVINAECPSYSIHTRVDPNDTQNFILDESHGNAIYPFIPSASNRYIQNRKSNKCLDANGGGNGQILRQMPCSFGSNQRFRFVFGPSNHYADVTYRIEHQATGRCVTLSGSSTNNNVDVVLANCNGSNHQKWTMGAFTNNGGALNFQSVRGGKCLQVENQSNSNGANIVQYNCADLDAQEWDFL